VVYKCIRSDVFLTAREASPTMSDFESFGAIKCAARRYLHPILGREGCGTKDGLFPRHSPGTRVNRLRANKMI